MMRKGINMWCATTVKEQMPDVPVEFAPGQIAVGRLRDTSKRTLPLATVTYEANGETLAFALPWSAVASSLNTNEPLRHRPA